MVVPEYYGKESSVMEFLEFLHALAWYDFLFLNWLFYYLIWINEMTIIYKCCWQNSLCIQILFVKAATLRVIYFQDGSEQNEISELNDNVSVAYETITM